LIEGCCSRFECRIADRHDGGDHDILLGEVLSFERFDRAPLVYHGGRYTNLG
jgi:3-hydroxy-9,10-secoandrosta-1,3,5(10)-triene-9,17-dione monooxygenase reductase component